MINAFQKKIKILQIYDGPYRRLLLHYFSSSSHQKSINLHSLICYVLQCELSDSKIGNDKNIQSYREIMYMDRYFHCLQVT